jgi:uncharacterized protein (TIRG00374 family)
MGGGALRIVGLAISLVSVAAVVWWASRQQPPSFPTSAADLALLVAAVGVYGLGMALRSERWRALLLASAATSARSDCYALTLVGYMGNNVLPLRAGDAMRVYLMAPRAGTSMRNVIGTLVAERVLDVVVIAALFGIVAYGVLSGVGVPGDTARGAAALIAGAALFAAIFLIAARSTEAGRRLIEYVRPMIVATRTLVGGHGAAMLGITVAIWLTEAGTYLLVGDAAGLDPSPVQAMYLVTLAGVFVLVPSGPGYLGTFDAAILFGANAIGATGSQAVSYLLLLRFVLLVPVTLAGLIALVTRYGGATAWRSARAETAGI